MTISAIVYCFIAAKIIGCKLQNKIPVSKTNLSTFSDDKFVFPGIEKMDLS